MVRRVESAGILLALGVIVFLVGLFVAEGLYPGYSVSQNPISDLGATCPDGGGCRIVQPSSTIFTGIMLVLGAVLILVGPLLYRDSRRLGFSVALAVAGAGILGAGIFNETWGVHGLFALAAFTAGPVAAIWSARFAQGFTRWLGPLLGGVALVGLAWQLLGTYGGSVYFGSLGDGGVERVIAYPFLLWALAFGGWLSSGPNLAFGRSVAHSPRANAAALVAGRDRPAPGAP